MRLVGHDTDFVVLQDDSIPRQIRVLVTVVIVLQRTFVIFLMLIFYAGRCSVRHGGVYLQLLERGKRAMARVARYARCRLSTKMNRI